MTTQHALREQLNLIDLTNWLEVMLLLRICSFWAGSKSQGCTVVQSQDFQSLGILLCEVKAYNCMPLSQMMGQDKPIWRLAFFSRLEERKGIKLFVDAVGSLNTSMLDMNRFEARPIAGCPVLVGLLEIVCATNVPISFVHGSPVTDTQQSLHWMMT